MAWSACLIFGSLLLEGVSSTVLQKRAFTPTVKSATVIGNVADPAINRDSCGSTRIGNRAFWTCRDSQPYNSAGVPVLPIWSSSASWSNFNADGTPALQQYGGGGSRNPYFPYQSDECNSNSAGSCSDGTRYALWPDSPPLVTSTVNNVVTAYTWIRKQHIKSESSYVLTLKYFSTNDPNPAVSLYKLTYNLGTSDQNALPTVTLVNENFWVYGSIPYGNYGNVIKDGIAYLFGQPSNGVLSLAKVPVGSIENVGAYQYWVNGAWTSTRPRIGDANIQISNGSAGGQGTYYFSTYWNKWVWIGQASISVSADFFITTADSITGPWATPVKFYSGQSGSYFLGAYSLQAHPGLGKSGTSTNDIYISYTKNDNFQNTQKYSTPLIHIVWN
ncbi:hypothetical protein FHL15_008610 [Xylaria flabelliformis]|uniref:DUF4185 domain-containing protein n=1 Tax=Xylaria flabelliformis TaxID=2512241 RepID=A0A553HR73_9PEZI|nr:hypothetical protein FHL15_008610 [Xylaria flabelliformis]